MGKAKKTTPPAGDQVRIEYVPLQAVQRWPRNPKLHDEPGLAASIDRFGFVAPLLLDETTGKLVAGHGRLEALTARRARGEAPPARVAVGPDGEWLVPVVRGVGFADEAAAEAYVLADNRLVEVGGWDDTMLAGILSDLARTSTGLDGVGFSPQDVTNLLDSVGYAPVLPDDSAGAAPADSGEDSDDEAPVDGVDEARAFSVFPVDRVTEATVGYFHNMPVELAVRRMPVHQAMLEINRLAAVEDPERVRKSHTAVSVADSWHHHRFKVPVAGGRLLEEWLADPVAMAKGFHFLIRHGGKMTHTLPLSISVMHGCRVTTNFPPAYAMYLYRKYCKAGARVLDTSAGYGGRLVGAIASRVVGSYVGIDPCHATIAASRQMLVDLGLPAGFGEMLEEAAEDVDPTDVGLCDFAFTSPPYFSLERYSDEPTQSWVRYQTPEAWRDGFLAPVMRLQFACLKPGCYSVVNIDDVAIQGVGKVPLLRWTQEAAEAAGFKNCGFEAALYNAVRPTSEENVSSESPLLFQKP